MGKFYIATCIATVVAGLWSRGGEAEPPNQVGPFMRAKLAHSQHLLEGITLGDYEMIAKHGQALSLLAQEATWRVLQTPEYLQHSAEFRRAADALTEAAREKNLDGAALGYVDLTMRCVNCHKYVRDVRASKRAG